MRSPKRNPTSRKRARGSSSRQSDAGRLRGSPPSDRPVLYHVEPPLAWVTLNRPEKKNALAGSMREEILERILQAGRDDSVRCLILTGAGGAFCSGGDISAMARIRQEDSRFEEIATWLKAGGAVVQALSSLPKPSLASLAGVAAGAGCNLALACDFRIASQTASLGETFSRVGLHPDWGGTYFLPRLVGVSKALELFATGEMISAPEAHRIGLVNRVVSDGHLEEETRAFALRLAAAPSLSFLAAKEAVGRSLSCSLSAMLVYERHAQQRCWESADAAEGIRAFLEKRPPRFQGR
jgi:2-(1,2-epoxy-1,2-dihydrophenyl)acetyl-CoA isomerase